MGVHAASGARLRVGSAAATLVLPGQDKTGAHYDIRLTVDDDAELCWLPEQLISADGIDLRVTTSVDLAAGARLLLGCSRRVRPSCRSSGPSRW